MKIRYPETSKNPSILFTARFPLIIGIKAMEKSSITGSSKKSVSGVIVKGLMRATEPITRRMLNILLPIMFPTHISVSFLKALTTDVAIVILTKDCQVQVR